LLFAINLNLFIVNDKYMLKLTCKMK